MTWEARMAEKAAERARLAQFEVDAQTAKENAEYDRKMREASVARFLVGPMAEDADGQRVGCDHCWSFEPSDRFTGEWYWMHRQIPGWTAYDEQDALYCSHVCHGPRGYRRVAVVYA